MANGERGPRPPVPETSRGGAASLMAHAADARPQGRLGDELSKRPGELAAGESGALGNASGEGSGRDAGAIPGAEGEGSGERGRVGDIPDILITSGATRGFWADAEWIACRDGKLRPAKPGIFPLANGSTARVVCACTRCETKAVIYEGLYFLREIGGHKGRGAKEVLRQQVLQAAQVVNAIGKHEYGLLSGSGVSSSSVRAVRGAGQAARSPQRQKRTTKKY